MGIEGVYAQIFGPTDDFALAQLLDHLAVAPTSHFGEAGDAADRLLSLLGRAAEKQIGDAFLANNMRYVVPVDHDRRQIELQLLGELEAVEPFNKNRRHF